MCEPQNCAAAVTQLKNVSHDHMAYLAGVKYQTFNEIYKDQVGAVQRAFLTYLQSVRSMAALLGTGAAAPSAERPQTAIELTEDGFPLLPENTLLKATIQVEQANLVKQYITQNYRTSLTYTLALTWLTTSL